MARKKILIVDDEESMRHMLTNMLEGEYEVKASADGKQALEDMSRDTFDFILCDIKMPGMDGMAVLEEMKRRRIFGSLIMMSAYGTTETALEAVKKGAYDYINKPFKSDELILTLKKAEERERLLRENILLKKELEKEFVFENIIGKNTKMLQIFETMKKIADVKSTVLITGESGTGKEIVAKALHFNSSRRDEPFIPVNCGAIPETLLESELFGYVKGAFTGATASRKGLFEEADRGTIFLDEIGELPLMLQVKLLRVLQEGEVRRVGETRAIRVDVRLIAASIKDLDKETKEGRFRDDLFYRLNVMTIHLPPLRERKDDIPILVDHFLRKYSQKLQKSIDRMEPEVMRLLMNYEWPGNVRELENIIERAIVLAESSTLNTEDIPEELALGPARSRISIPFLGETDLSIKKVERKVEEELIRRALMRTGGNKTQAAKLLEISHRALLYKIKEYGIE